MKINKKLILTLFTIIITVVSAVINFPEFSKGNKATAGNLTVSVIFLLLWFLFSVYWGIKKDTEYRKFFLIYWGINLISFLLIWIVTYTKFSPVFLILFSVWYGAPVYGFRYLLNSDVITLVIVTAPLGMICSSLGYLLGMILEKGNK